MTIAASAVPSSEALSRRDRSIARLEVILVPRQPLSPGRYRVVLHATLGQANVVAPAPWEFSVERR